MYNITFGKPFRCLEKGADVEDSIDSVSQLIRYLGPTGQMPWLDYLLSKNPVRRIGPASASRTIGYSYQKLAERLETKTDRDIMLDQFIDTESQYPDTVDKDIVVGYAFSNVVAGA